MSESAGGGVWSRALALGMLAFLVYPVLRLAGGGVAVAQAAPAAAAAAVVLAGYVWAGWRQPAPDGLLWAVLAGMTALATAVPVVWGPGWLGLLLYPAVAAALLLPGPAGVVSAAGLGGATVAVGLGTGAPRDAVLSISLITILAGLAAAGVARLTRLTSELRAAQAGVARLAGAEERLRLARDLHDAVKQQLFVAALELGAGRASLDAGDPGASDHSATVHLEKAEQAVRDARAELARLITGMRPAGPIGPGGLGLAVSLRRYLDDWGHRNKITARFCGTGEDSCPPEVREAMLWAAQEALTNVARHAKASTVSVCVGSREGGVRVQVADDGIGFAAASGPDGHGLSIMAERLERAGGRACITGSPGSGSTVTLSWPDASTGTGRR